MPLTGRVHSSLSLVSLSSVGLDQTQVRPSGGAGLSRGAHTLHLRIKRPSPRVNLRGVSATRAYLRDVSAVRTTQGLPSKLVQLCSSCTGAQCDCLFLDSRSSVAQRGYSETETEALWTTPKPGSPQRYALS